MDLAIVRVLDAERSARDAVTQYTADADRVRQEARSQARVIAERAAERVARVHEWTTARLRDTVDRLDAQRTALLQPAPPDPDEPARVARALDQLAAELTGGTE